MRYDCLSIKLPTKSQFWNVIYKVAFNFNKTNETSITIDI